MFRTAIPVCALLACLYYLAYRPEVQEEAKSPRPEPPRAATLFPRTPHPASNGISERPSTFAGLSRLRESERMFAQFTAGRAWMASNAERFADLSASDSARRVATVLKAADRADEQCEPAEDVTSRRFAGLDPADLVRWGDLFGLADDAMVDTTPALPAPAKTVAARIDGASKAAPAAIFASDDGATLKSNHDVPPASAANSADASAKLDAEMEARRQKIRHVLELYEKKRLNTRDKSPWAVMHYIVAYGVSSEVEAGGPGGEPVTAVGWLCFNRPTAGLRMFSLSGDRLLPLEGPGLQGHPGQLLAILAQVKVMSDYPIHVGGKEFTIADLIEYEKRTCRPRTELTFKLIGLSHYRDTDETWKSESGEEWSIPRLIREEIAQPIRGATCGGTHRLFGIYYPVQKRRKEGKPIEGEYARAAKYISDYNDYTFKLQNPDGSFSTEWYVGRGNRSDDARKLQTTGHMLEFMAFSVPDETLRDPRMVKAVDFLTNLLYDNPNRTWEIGPLGHALHALAIYESRVFPHKASPSGEVVVSDRAIEVAARPGAIPRPAAEIEPIPAAREKSPTHSVLVIPRLSAAAPSHPISGEDKRETPSDGPRLFGP